MGIVMTKVRLMNLGDWLAKRQGRLRPDQVRSIELEMLVDTGACRPAIPEEVVEALEIPRPGTNRQPVRLADGTVREFEIVQVVFEILGREDHCGFYVLPRGATPLLGQVPLEVLDLVVVPSTGEVTTNPAHGGRWILDMLSVA
jgi:clan AA aspartic protease